MTRRFLAFGFLVAVAIGASARTPWFAAVAIEQELASRQIKQAPVTSIGLRISRHVAFAGQHVQLRSVIDREADVEVGTLSFSVTRIGFFHRRLGKMVFSDDAIGTSVFPEEAFDGLSTQQGSHGLSWTHLTPAEKGFDGKLDTKRYGAFLITCSWAVRGNPGKKLHSNPVLLQVIPRTNPLNGRAEVESTRLWKEGIDGEQDFEELYDQARAAWDVVE